MVKEDRLNIVLERMKTIAQDDFNGDLPGNLPAIYDRLTKVEKAVLLYDIATRYFDVKQVVEIKNSTPAVVKQVEQEKLIETDRQETLKLRIWLIKGLFVATVMVAGITAVLHAQSTEQAVKHIVEIFSIIVGK